MAKRTKLQKKQAETRRKESFVFTEHGVTIVSKPGTAVSSKQVESSVTPELQTRVQKDLLRTIVISALMFGLLFGIYFYLR